MAQTETTVSPPFEDGLDKRIGKCGERLGPQDLNFHQVPR